jgi:hypothetical protein
VGDACGGVGEAGWDAGGVAAATNVPLASSDSRLCDGERSADGDVGDVALAVTGEVLCAPLAPLGTHYSTVKSLAADAELPGSVSTNPSHALP